MEKKSENMSLQEATIKALYNELDDSDEIRDVEGVVDDVLVITDPEITKDEYEEVIERAQEIVEDTPEGDIPFDEDYLGQYLQTCPICGSSFVEDHLLEPGATCPICLEQPEAFVVVGKIDSDVAIEEELGLGDEDEVTDEFDTGSEFDLGRSEVEEEPTDVEPTPETEEEPNENFERSGGRRASNLRLGRDVASKELPSGSILAENKEVMTEAKYKVSSYYDLKYRGLEDSLETDDYDEARNFVWDKVQKGGAVELVDTETGDRKRFVSKTSEQDETAVDIEDYLDESKSLKVEKKIVIDNLGETYTIDTDANTYTIKTANGEKTFSFEKMDEFIKQYRGVNRIYKPFSLLAYTDYKHGNLKEWDVVGGKELVESVEVNDSDVCDINLDLSKKGEVKDTVKLAIKGIEHTTDKISNAIQSRFGGVYKSDVTGKTYTQDIRVADDLWLTFLYYDDATETFWFVLDGDISRDPELVIKNQESKKKQ